MKPIPIWYRWLLIVIATLIMCACRSPLQDNGQPLLPPLVAGSMVTPRDGTFRASKYEALTSEDAQPSHPSPTRRANQERSEGGDITTPKNANQSTRPATAAELTRVVHATKTDIQLQRIESILVSSGTELGEPTRALRSRAQRMSKPGVYLRVHDQSDGLQSVDAQLDGEVGDLESPSADDPIAPLPSAPPSAPVVNQDPLIQNPKVEHSPAEFISPQGSLVGKLTINYEPAPYTDFVRSECPIESVPECWDVLPTEQMNFKRREPALLYPDEYICDGGDAKSHVHVRNDWSLRGLDPEDTLGHYDRLDGKVVVEPSNRIYIYAPRFAAVRKVTAPHQSEKNLQVQLAQRDLFVITDELEQGTNQFSQRLAAERHLALQPPSSFKSRQPGVERSQAQGLHALAKDLSVHENLRLMKYGVHRQSEKARLAELTARAIAWSHDKAVQVILDEVVAQTRVSRQGTGQIFLVGSKGPAKLRVIKTASVSDALPGEEVEFTLRFDNIGYQPIGNVTIVDNLTTRLEYIGDSQQCSLEAGFIYDENQADSLTLRWVITDPIASGKGGAIRFRCRVR